MKHLLTYPSSQNGPGKTPGKTPRKIERRFNEIIDLEPFHGFIAYLAARFKRVMAADDNYAELCRLGKLLQRARRRLRDTKMHNFKTGLKQTMLRQPVWRRKVLDELGGDAALVRWDAKARKAAVRALDPKPYKAPKYKRPPLASLRLGMIELPPIRTAFDVKTDESGCFRLAPIPSVRAKRPKDFEPEELTWTQQWERKEAWRLRADLRRRQYKPVDESTLKGYWHKDEFNNVIYRMAPIPLLPDELRGVRVDEIDEGCPNTSSPHLWAGPQGGEVAERNEVVAGMLSAINPCDNSQTIDPPIDFLSNDKNPLSPAGVEKGEQDNSYPECPD